VGREKGEKRNDCRRQTTVNLGTCSALLGQGC
jgi:hypothetical protein